MSQDQYGLTEGFYTPASLVGAIGAMLSIAAEDTNISDQAMLNLIRNSVGALLVAGSAFAGGGGMVAATAEESGEAVNVEAIAPDLTDADASAAIAEVEAMFGFGS